jgi:hypothetical protein
MFAPPEGSLLSEVMIDRRHQCDYLCPLAAGMLGFPYANVARALTGGVNRELSLIQLVCFAFLYGALAIVVLLTWIVPTTQRWVDSILGRFFNDRTMCVRQFIGFSAANALFILGIGGVLLLHNGRPYTLGAAIAATLVIVALIRVVVERAHHSHALRHDGLTRTRILSDDIGKLRIENVANKKGALMSTDRVLFLIHFVRAGSLLAMCFGACMVLLNGIDMLFTHRLRMTFDEHLMFVLGGGLFVLVSGLGVLVGQALKSLRQQISQALGQEE